MKYCKCWAPEEANGKTCVRCGGKRPTAEELAFQQFNVSMLNVISREKDPEQWERFAARCTEFENKYC